MIVIPAIDIKNGRCVRLEQGLMSRETVYSENPRDMAIRWYKEGAEQLHLVDLDGAVQGHPVNKGLIKNIVEAVPIPIQLGGGIRDMRAVEAYLELGICKIILGTAAHKNPEFLESTCKRFPGKIILGIDAREGFLAVEGWTESTDISPLEIAKKYHSLEISAIIYTDIQRDGMSSGPNIKAIRNLAKAVDTPVIASGGISGLDDVAKLLPLSKHGVTGMITGRAIYNGSLSLRDAIKLARDT